MTNGYYKKTNVLLVTTAYLFVVLTHILLLPHHGQKSLNPQSRYNSIFKRKLENVNAQAFSLMHRTDKSVLNKEQKLQCLFIRLAGSFFTLPYVARSGRQSKSQLPLPIGYYISPYPPSRLSLRI